MTHFIRIASAVLLCTIMLSGCEAWHYYRPLPAGHDAELWRPERIVERDFDAQTANPADLVAGRGTAESDGRTGADAVDRMRRGRSTPLPASSISQIGSGGAAAGAAGGQ